MRAYVSDEALPPRSLDEVLMLEAEFPIEDPHDADAGFDDDDDGEFQDEEEELIAW